MADARVRSRSLDTAAFRGSAGCIIVVWALLIAALIYWLATALN
jgi:hypothetical protein